jgi:signal transduction histidine kinase
MADWCQFDLIEDGQIHRRAGAHADPAKAQLVKKLARSYPPSWTSPHPQVQVLRSGEALLLVDIDDYIRQHTVDDAHARLIRELGFASGVVVPLKARERILGALTLASSVPEHRMGQVELELAEELARRAAMAIDNALLYRQARQAIRVRDQFLSIASHELRTPLTSLMMRVQWLQEWGGGEIPAEISRSLDVVTRQGKRLKRQVDDLLDVSRLEAGRLELQRAEVDLVELVEDVIATFELGLARAGCEVRRDMPEPVRGCWDRSRLEQVISNLLSNALKFGAGHPIDIGVRWAERTALMVVSDHGMGIGQAEQKRIFDRFARAVSSTHFGGLGLGLYICREIVAAHGGTIRVESRLGEGARFIVELPA